jgi:hypothetical protein
MTKPNQQPNDQHVIIIIVPYPKELLRPQDVCHESCPIVENCFEKGQLANGKSTKKKGLKVVMSLKSKPEAATSLDASKTIPAENRMTGD